MSIVVSMNWPHVTAGQYDALNELVNFDADPPEGAIAHTAWITESGLRVVDIWRSREDFERFSTGRLMTAIDQVPGFHGEPIVEFNELHNFAVTPATVAA